MSAIQRVQADLRERDWSIVTEAELGLRDLRHVILETLYDPDVLIRDTGGPVRDRYRAKDCCVYRWHGSHLELASAGKGPGRIGCGDRARDVPRVDFLGCPGCRDLVAAQLSLIPPERRRVQGTWGVHTFRSFTSVVDSPHKDDFEYGLVYVLDRVGGGAESYLLENDRETVVVEHQLQPGEMLVFKDSKFFHGATPLEGADSRRDALVIQINAPEDLELAQTEGLL